VPLIFIVFVTAVKDAIEDYRRTMLDNELNNSPVHRLVSWQNVNVNPGAISLWRRIKKSSTKIVLSVFRTLKRIGKVSKTREDENSEDEKGQAYAKQSIDDTRASLQNRDEIQMASESQPPSQQDDIISESPANGASLDTANVPIKRDATDLINHKRIVSGNARFQRDCWKNVQVGDFVRIYNDDQIPADVLILSTSDPEGACYVETKNLDGETNLKLRNALHAGRNIKHARDCERAEFMVESEAPQPNLYQYSGVARWRQEILKNSNTETHEMMEPVSINNLLLRGCNLRNTKWVLGVVIFTGGDTKIMINSGITPSKRSRIARELNWNVIYNFAILLVMCIVSGLVEGLAWAKQGSSMRFFEFGSIGNGKPALDGFITFWAAIILFQNLVPISLFISLEIIKTAQAFFIYSDEHMYYEKLDYPCTPKSWNISDDVGQIEYIFSDKTGTLTQNVMEFKKATINGVAYGEAYTEAQAGMQRRQGIDTNCPSSDTNDRRNKKDE
jgi:phospholipid-translocating ATPase